MNARPSLAVSLGDPAGIGPEIVVRAARRAAVRRACRLTVFGDESVLAIVGFDGRRRGSVPTAIEAVEPVTTLRCRGSLPAPGKRAGEAAFRYLDAAARATLAGRFDALVTAPLSKYWLDRAGHHYDGHTGYLSELAGSEATMMLAGRRLRVVLVTTHVALAEVPGRLTAALVRDRARTAAVFLRERLGVVRPRLAVAALNPHAGEGGLFGDEERRVIRPAVRSLARAGFDVSGPLPADTLFAAAAGGDYDAVVCMYHDQALIPLKLLEFGRSVNISMGLPFVRTSPDHGTAFDLAGTGNASADSMTAAILAAAEMARHAQVGRKA
ncbi:MAG: 4-hydroxythreonine-4-phosphate dehydrogenase PdxA [Myxococcales bacterium]|nr:MAG: 4-hydroxythreonine-4-phosphate dehydrogenase PdxA [Myxococcales bacterium]